LASVEKYAKQTHKNINRINVFLFLFSLSFHVIFYFISKVNSYNIILKRDIYNSFIHNLFVLCLGFITGSRTLAFDYINNSSQTLVYKMKEKSYLYCFESVKCSVFVLGFGYHRLISGFQGLNF
jgi:hypothetical protein